MAEDLPANDGRAAALFGIGLLLPILGGGNVFVLLEPEPALTLFAASSAGTALILAAGRPSTPFSELSIASCLILFFVVWMTNYAVRPIGPRVPAQTLGLFSGTALSLAWLWRGGSVREMRGFVIGLLLGCICSAAYAQHQYWYVFPRIAPILEASGREPMVAVNANFYSPNSYAPFIAASLLLALPFLSSSEPASLRIFTATGFLILLATLVLTRSRSTLAILSLVAAGSLVERVALNRRKALAALAAIAIALGASAGWLVDFSELWRVGMVGRLRIWEAAIGMIADHWLFGVGLGRFGELFREYQVTDYYTRYPHNFWIEIFAETGLFGIFPLTAFLAATTGRAFAPRPDGVSDDRHRRAFALASLLLVAHATVDIDWHAPANVVLTLLCFTVAATAPETRT